MPTIKVYYFDFRGRAEVIRLLLALGGRAFEDCRFSSEDWPKHKDGAPFGQAPFVEIDGKKFGQSVAIANYFAKEVGAYGKTNMEALRIDEVVGIHGDMWNAIIKVFSEKDEAKKAELDKKMTEEDMPRMFGFFAKLLKESGTGLFVGNDLTLADLCAYDMVFNMKKMGKVDACAKFPELKTLSDKVEANSNIKAYLSKRKETDF